MMKKKYFVYILTNHTNTVFYTGVTNNWQRRIWEHKQGFSISSFCKRYRLYKLIWLQEFSDPQEAIVVEKKVKDMRREKKLKLIQESNKNFQDIFTLY